MWTADKIDFQLVNTSYNSADLPFYCTRNGSNFVINPGAAWVGGFYYKLDAPLSIPAPTNAGAMPRIDLIVIRADMASGSVNIKTVQGQPSSGPVVPEPAPTRAVGGFWEMPLWAINVPANNGTASLMDRRHFDGPGVTYVPWNRSGISQGLPPGNFTIDMDVNASFGMEEGFRGQDGDMVTRTLGKRRSWTPDIFTVTNKPSDANRVGLWRRVAPGTVAFTLQITNPSTTAVTSTTGITVTLPENTSAALPTIVTGLLENLENRDSYPNLMHIVAKTSEFGAAMHLYTPNTDSLKEGLDQLYKIPGKSTLTISGQFETAAFEGRTANRA